MIFNNNYSNLNNQHIKCITTRLIVIDNAPLTALFRNCPLLKELSFNTMCCWLGFIKGALSSLRIFLSIESLFKMMKNAFYLTSKALFVLKIFQFLSSKRLD